MSNVVILKVNSQKNTYIRAIMNKWLINSADLIKVSNKKTNYIHANFAGVTRSTLKGLDDTGWIQELTLRSSTENSEMQ